MEDWSLWRYSRSMVNSWLAWLSKKFSELLFSAWCPCGIKSLEAPALGSILDLAVLQLGRINLPWDYINDPSRHLNSRCFASDLIPSPLSVSRRTVGLSWAIGQALEGIFTSQSMESREPREIQMTVKNSYECCHQKTHWTNKPSNWQMLEAKAL